MALASDFAQFIAGGSSTTSSCAPSDSTMAFSAATCGTQRIRKALPKHPRPMGAQTTPHSSVVSYFQHARAAPAPPAPRTAS